MPSSKVPGAVEPRLAEAQRRVHVEMRIDERRRREAAADVDLPRAGGGKSWFNRDDVLARDANVLIAPSIGERRAAQDEVHHHSPSHSAGAHCQPADRAQSLWRTRPRTARILHRQPRWRHARKISVFGLAR
jgi:hypothetical protein